jgi:hypothetical protein
MKGSSTTVQTAASISLASDKLSISASFDSTVSISNIQFNDYKNNVSKTQIDAVGGRYIMFDFFFFETNLKLNEKKSIK